MCEYSQQRCARWQKAFKSNLKRREIVVNSNLRLLLDLTRVSSFSTLVPKVKICLDDHHSDVVIVTALSCKIKSNLRKVYEEKSETSLRRKTSVKSNFHLCLSDKFPLLLDLNVEI